MVFYAILFVQNFRTEVLVLQKNSFLESLGVSFHFGFDQETLRRLQTGLNVAYK